MADDGKYPLQIHALLILGQRVQTADINAEILLQQLQEGNVELRLLIPGPQQKAHAGGFADQVHRDQHKGSITGLLAGIRFVPLQ
ncbi:hypothetical protein D3C75_757920 [compost metagenome]